MEKELSFIVKDQQRNDIKCDVLLVTKIDDSDYIVFTDYISDESGEIPLQFAKVIDNKNTHILENVYDESVIEDIKEKLLETTIVLSDNLIRKSGENITDVTFKEKNTLSLDKECTVIGYIREYRLSTDFNYANNEAGINIIVDKKDGNNYIKVSTDETNKVINEFNENIKNTLEGEY